MKKCPKCGAFVSGSATKCRNCGASLTAEPKKVAPKPAPAPAPKAVPQPQSQPKEAGKTVLVAHKLEGLVVEIILCPKCGAKNSSNAKFCNQCGHSLGVEFNKKEEQVAPKVEEAKVTETPKVDCVVCGAKNDEDAIFCKACGASLKPVVAPVVEEPAPVVEEPTSEVPAKVCSCCGTQVSEEVKFCPNCGTSLVAPVVAPAGASEPAPVVEEPAPAEEATPVSESSNEDAGVEKEPEVDPLDEDPPYVYIPDEEETKEKNNGDDIKDNKMGVLSIVAMALLSILPIMFILIPFLTDSLGVQNDVFYTFYYSFKNLVDAGYYGWSAWLTAALLVVMLAGCFITALVALVLGGIKSYQGTQENRYYNLVPLSAFSFVTFAFFALWLYSQYAYIGATSHFPIAYWIGLGLGGGLLLISVALRKIDRYSDGVDTINLVKTGVGFGIAILLAGVVAFALFPYLLGSTVSYFYISNVFGYIDEAITSIGTSSVEAIAYLIMAAVGLIVLFIASLIAIVFALNLAADHGKYPALITASSVAFGGCAVYFASIFLIFYRNLFVCDFVIWMPIVLLVLSILSMGAAIAGNAIRTKQKNDALLASDGLPR